MVDVTRVHLSASTDGVPVLVTATSSPGDVIHTATNTANNLDEVYLWATNTAASGIDLTLQLGEVGGHALTRMSVSGGNGPNFILPGSTFDGGKVVRAYATVSGINIWGHVNRIDQS